MENTPTISYDKESSDYDREENKSWISQFCSKSENSYFVEVDTDFITDAFNLYGINSDFHLYRQALNLILDRQNYENMDSDIDDDELQANAECIYGMIHARYILTAQGLDAMLQKFKECTFGTCPRVYCNNYNLLPIGLSDKPGNGCVKLFCPCCKDIYNPPLDYSRIDGAFFGTTFPHIFLLAYPEYITNAKKLFQPKIYGYKIHESSPYYGKNGNGKEQ